MVRAVALSKRYTRSDRWALNDVSCDLRAGRVTGLLGPNGSGKTTFARLLVGLLKPTSGYIEIDGVKLAARSRSPVPIGYVPQQVPAFPGVSGRDLIEFVLVTQGYWGARLKAARQTVVERLQLAEIERKLVWHMSGGESRLTLLAAALSFHPPLLVLDEPSTGLDLHHRRRLWTILEEVKQAYSPTILLVTHDVKDAEQVIDDALILKSGRLALAGNVAHLRRSYGPHVRISVVSGDNGPPTSGDWQPAGPGRWEQLLPKEQVDGALAALRAALQGGAAELSIRSASLEDIVLAEAMPEVPG